MKADTILVPVDSSEYRETVLDLATSLARACEAKLVIVYVADPARTYGESKEITVRCPLSLGGRG